MESALTRWAGLPSKSSRRGRLVSLNSWCASSHHPFCKTEMGREGGGRGEGSFLHPVAGENRKQQLASSQLESAHTESQILLSRFKCAWCHDVKRSSYPGEDQSGSGVCPPGSLRGPSLSTLPLGLNNIVNPWPQLLTFYTHQAPSLMVGFWESML